ncbi:GerAB/ArcD/ProY family transporter [Anaerobacillus alkalilacustris]|uniref:GerAB/ArcD/ProY family transporter n=1 Tax=Anaerobacillus alkalilacustris TaxID=393763 RepID=UPI003CCC31AA
MEFHCIFVLYVFFYLTSRIIRDFTELLKVSILKETPMEVITFTMVLLMVY